MGTAGRREVFPTRRYYKARERLSHFHREIDEKLELFCHDPLHPSLRFHELDRLAYKNWWTYRVNDDIRVVVSDQQDCWVVCYVAHHDDAYQWARRKRFTLDLLTGSYSMAPPADEVAETTSAPEEAPEVFHVPLSGYTPEQIMRLGIPDRDWAEQLTQATEEQLARILVKALDDDWFPEDVIERLMHLADKTKPYRELLPPQISVLMPSELFRRRPRDFWSPESEQDIRKAIQRGWQEWIIFLHPAQRDAVKRDLKGAIRVGGGAGTGKTVVAAHRTAWLATERYPNEPILLTTFTGVLADNLKQRVEQIIGPLHGTGIEVINLHALAMRLFKQRLNRTETVVDTEAQNALLEQAIREVNSPYNLAFVRPEWETIIDPWQVRDLETYLQIDRVGRKMPLQRTQREELWQVFDRMWRLLEEQHRTTFSTVCYAVAEYLNQHPEARYRCVVVDEAQDFGPAELTLVRALAPTDLENALFLCADTRQRIYRPAVPWVRFGIDTRGRSYTLRVNYRTTRQIQDFAERVLPEAIEGVQEDETRILSDRPVALMHGVVPEAHGYENIPAEMRGLKDWIYRCLNDNIQPGEIAIFARSENALKEVEHMLREEVLQERGIQARRLQRDTPPVPHELNYGTAHNAKGLEFRAVAVVRVTATYFPHYSAIKDIADTAERKAKEDQERQLLYTVCTRARERLYISWSPTTGRSKFLPNR
jgi:superfamily I DNA/RNA helicase